MATSPGNLLMNLYCTISYEMISYLHLGDQNCAMFHVWSHHQLALHTMTPQPLYSVTFPMVVSETNTPFTALSTCIATFSYPCTPASLCLITFSKAPPFTVQILSWFDIPNCNTSRLLNYIGFFLDYLFN